MIENQKMEEQEIPDKNIFMICNKLNPDALSNLSEDYHIRNCRVDELDIWKAMPFDDPKEADEYFPFMTDFFNNVYGSKIDLFFKKCFFVCDRNNKPIATAFIWKAYETFNTVHWLKVLKEYEAKGIGRALMSFIMKDLEEKDYPVYLHTQPASYRAIKLYSDFGFFLLSDPVIGRRTNDLNESLPILEKYIPEKDFKKLRITKAPEFFIEKLKSVKDEQF